MSTIKDRWAVATMEYGDFGVYNGWYSDKKDAEDVLELMKKKIPHIKWQLVKKSDCAS